VDIAVHEGNVDPDGDERRVAVLGRHDGVHRRSGERTWRYFRLTYVVLRPVESRRRPTTAHPCT
jgi:hypothetical protein